MADQVGWIVDEDERGEYVYACDEHTPDDKREPHRAVLRQEADDGEHCCHICGLELYAAEAF